MFRSPYNQFKLRPANELIRRSPYFIQRPDMTAVMYDVRHKIVLGCGRKVHL